MKGTILVLAALLIALFSQPVAFCDDIITLRAGPGPLLTRTDGTTYRTFTNFTGTISLAANQVAELLHFSCYSTNAPSGRSIPSQAIRVAADFGDVTLAYDYNNVHGLFGISANFSIGGEYNGSGRDRPVTFRGPATVRLEQGIAISESASWDARAIATVKVTTLVGGTAALSADDDSIIVAEGVGPVEIVLESSADLKQSWQSAAPGIYGSSDKKRFFRLKAMEREPR